MTTIATRRRTQTVPHTLLVTQTDIERLVTMKTAMRVTAQAFRAMARGHTLMPAKVYLTLPDGSDFRAMPAALFRPTACGMKWVNVHLRNRTKGLPTVMATIILNDPATGFPTAIMDGMLLTRLRTGAAGGVAAKALARPHSRVVGLVGCGAQAMFQLQALLESFRLTEARVWGALPGEAGRFARRAARTLRLPCVPVKTVRACVEDADLIVTITPSRRPLVMREWVKPGAHINAMGADAPGKQELDPAILRAATVVVDDLPQAIHGGEMNVPVAQGQYDQKRIQGTLGGVLVGRVRGRSSSTEITVFDSTGLAIHDVALAAEVLRLARQAGRGRKIRLFRHG